MNQFYLVGARGFEPPTPCTPCKCATRLRHAPTGPTLSGGRANAPAPCAHHTRLELETQRAMRPRRARGLRLTSRRIALDVGGAYIRIHGFVVVKRDKK